MKEKDCKILARKTLKKVSNNGDLTKYYLKIATGEFKSDGLLIIRLTLVKDLTFKDEQILYRMGFNIVKRYKNYTLFEQTNAFAVSTFHEIFNWYWFIETKLK